MLIKINKASFDAAFARHETKLATYQQLKTECEKFITITNEEAFQADPIGYFDATFVVKVKATNPMSLTPEKYFTVMGADYNVIRLAAKEFNQASGTLKAPLLKDYEVHTENKEQEKRLIKVLNFLTSAKELGVNERLLVGAASNFALEYSLLDGDKVWPSEKFIKS